MTPDKYPVPDWLDVSRETHERLIALHDLMVRWNAKINLVSAASLPNAWSRHVLDSAQLWAFRPPQADRWLDIGSGGGFPGLVVAILARQDEPKLLVTLVESDKRKAAFLRVASQDLQLNTEVICDRVERLAPFGAKIMSARALAPLKDLLPHALRHLAPEAIALFLKGERFRDELQEAKLLYDFVSEDSSSKTGERAVVLKIRDIHLA